MRDILAALVEQTSNQALAINAITDHVQALEVVLKRKLPDFEIELVAEIAIQNQKSKEQTQQIRKQITELRALLSRFLG